MSLDHPTVRRIARLARLHVDEDQVEHLVGELNNILDWVEQLEEVDVDGVEPMTSVVAMGLRRRADEVTDGGYADDVIANAREARHGFFAVPKVVE